MKKIKTLIILTLLFVSVGCDRECFKTSDCKKEGKAGPCEALIYGYYYDQEQEKCVEFMWGGCDGVRPFETMEECEKNCHCD